MLLDESPYERILCEPPPAVVVGHKRKPSLGRILRNSSLRMPRQPVGRRDDASPAKPSIARRYGRFVARCGVRRNCKRSKQTWYRRTGQSGDRTSPPDGSSRLRQRTGEDSAQARSGGRLSTSPRNRSEMSTSMRCSRHANCFDDGSTSVVAVARFPGEVFSFIISRLPSNSVECRSSSIPDLIQLTLSIPTKSNSLARFFLACCAEGLN